MVMTCFDARLVRQTAGSLAQHWHSGSSLLRKQRSACIPPYCSTKITDVAVPPSTVLQYRTTKATEYCTARAWLQYPITVLGVQYGATHAAHRPKDTIIEKVRINENWKSGVDRPCVLLSRLTRVLRSTAILRCHADGYLSIPPYSEALARSLSAHCCSVNTTRRTASHGGRGLG